MLRGNLSTRPFYNERLATLAIGLLAVVAFALTLFNGREITALSAERRALRDRIQADRLAAESIRGRAATVERTVDRTVLARLAASTGEANDVIDQRTFSWTAFFRLLETTLPVDVRLVVVSPRVEQGAFRVAMTVVARDLSDVAAFVDALLDTGRFYDAATLEQQRRDDGDFNAVVEAAYLTPAGHTAGPAVSAAAATPVRPAR